MMATDLIRYVASEIAADGPEGSSIDRLGGFIDDYASQQSSTSNVDESVIDEDLRRYVIQALGRLPNISPGHFVKASRPTKKETKRKGKGRQDASSDEKDDMPTSTPRSKINSASLEASADHVDVQESDKSKKLQDLLTEYGSSFRLVANKESIDTVCGTMVLEMSVAVCQLYFFVMRTRGKGASFPQIGKRFDYTTSSTFFLVKQLCDANLAIKFRAKDGSVHVSWIVAKQYAHLCPHINQETLLDGQANSGAVDDDDDENQQGGFEEDEADTLFADVSLQEMSPEAVQDLIRRGHNKGLERVASQGEDDDEEESVRGEEEEEDSRSLITDNRDDSGMITLHGLLAYPSVELAKQEILLRDRGLVRMRLLKLLLASKNHATIRADLIVRIGIKEPNPVMRKAFNAILRQMEAEDLIRRCLLRRPLQHDKDHKDHCWMATEMGREYVDQMSISLQHREIKRLKVELNQEIEKSKSKILMESSFNKQMLDLIEECQEGGMTIERMNLIMGGNKARKRDLDHMLTALKKPSNAYYDDYTLFSALEQEGRTRSQRFYTRQWRPTHLAPNESRRVDSRIVDAWVTLPFEQDVSSTPLQSKGKGKMKSSQTVTQDDDEGDEEDQDQIGSESSVEKPQRVRKKAKSKITTESQEPKMKGRPRKHHTERALRVARQYKEKKEARIKEEEERRGVEDLLGESGAQVRTRKRKSISSQVDTDAETNIVEATQTIPSREEAAAQTDEIVEPLPPSPFTVPTSSTPKTPIRKGEYSQSTLTSTPVIAKRGRLASGDVKRTSINLTLQLKIDALKDFFKKEKVFESTTFENVYTQFLRETLGDGVNTQPYEMDRKLRLKLLNQFEREGLICSKKVPAPVISKDKLRIVWHIKDIREERLGKYCRDVSNGNVRRDGSRRGVDGKWERAVAKKPVLLETHEIDPVDEFLIRLGSGSEFEATTLEELLSKDEIREVFMDHEKVRSQYTGRFSGQGAQVRYLYSTVMQLLNEGQYKLADKTFDLTWWIKEARLEQYLRLVTPPKDDLIMEASQDIRLKTLPVKRIPSNVQSALRISEERVGFHEALQPLLDILTSFHLSEPVQIDESGQVWGNATGRDSFTYRFYSTGRIAQEQLHFEETDTSQSFDLSNPEEAEKYWQLTGDYFTLQEYESVRREMTAEQVALYKNLLTKTAWSPNYFMMKPQKFFLRKTMSLGADSNVVKDEELLERISKVCLTPKDIVRRWYERRYKVPISTTPSRSRESSSRGEGAKRSVAVKTDKSRNALPPAQGKPLSIRKLNAIKRREAKERKNRFEEFGKIVNSCLVEMGFNEDACTTILARLAYVRRQYSKSDATLSTKRVRSIFREVQRGFEVGDVTWKDIENRRRRPMQPTPIEKEVSVKVQDKEGPRSRKSAFTWTRDRDELLRDAVVILRCRDRFRSKNPSTIRRNWAALDQIFPDIGAQSRFGRFDRLEKAVGEEAYLQQMELEWDKVWAENRGDELEDEYPADPINFDLMHHINFLRSHIDKIKVARDVDNATADPLPLDIALLLPYFDYDRPILSHDHPANTLARSLLADPSTEARSKSLRANAFTLGTTGDGNAPYTADQQTSLLNIEREGGLIKGVIKMILNTNESEYSESIATALCKDNTSGDIFEESILEMMDSRMIKRKTKEDREMPNRNVTFTEEYERFHLDPLETIPFWEVTGEIDHLLKKKETRLYQTTEDQETAASLFLLGADQVDADIDFSPVDKFKSDVFFNAKKLNDANLEVPIKLQVRSQRQNSRKKWAELIKEKEAPNDDVLKWLDEDLHNIKAKVASSWTNWFVQFKTKEEQIAAKKLRERLQKAGPNGISMGDISSRESLEQSLLPLLREGDLPLIFIAGYSESRIISAEYIEQWTIRLHSGRRLFPFKWYDIHGNHLSQIWSQCVKLVVHAIMTRPGITLAQLTIQFKLVMDRMELCKIIDYACSLYIIDKVFSLDDNIRGSQTEWNASNDNEIALKAHPILE